MKSIFIHLRRSFKLLLLLFLGLFIIVSIMYVLYKPVYAVKFNGEIIGYTENKAQLQEKINEYMKTGDNKDIAFVELDSLPEYEMCFSKNEEISNDAEVFDKIISTGTSYYKYYAILVDKEEKYYVPTYEEAEKTIQDLKDKKSTNADKISYVVKYETEKKDFTESKDIVTALYVEPKKTTTTTTKKTTSSSSTSYPSGKAAGTVNTSTKISNNKVAIGISLQRPISGTITSRFGARSSIRSSAHTGLDIAAPKGTSIGAAASGTVTFAGRKGSYGNMIVIDHGNGVQTYYAHCDKIYVSLGQSISQGQSIGAVGTTGNSTGPHLHLEVRVNGVAQNPQNYVY